jgi:hypothetical protein
MKTFFIDSDNNISVFSSVEEAGAAPGLERFDSVDQFRALAKHWPASRLVEIWNSLTGVKPVERFTDRKTAVARIWKVIQQLGSAAAAAATAPDAGDKGNSGQPQRGRQLQRHAGRKNTKTARVLALLKRPTGASLKHLVKATGWQPHSVRGFLSGHLHKKLGLRVKSFQRDGERVYVIRG